MQVSVENTTDLERRLTVELPREELTRKINDRLEELKDQVSVEGFRPGKAPIDVVRQKFGARIQEEVLSETINDSLQQALAQEQLEPLDKPVVEIDESSTESVLRYSARFEIMPQLDIQPVEQIKMVRPIVEITEADVDNLVEKLRFQRLSWKPANRPARAGDRLTIDYSGKVEGQAFPGSVAQGLPVVIGEGSLLPGFEDQLVGLTQGSSANIDVTIPESFPAADYRGKTASFEVKVNQVEQGQLPALDDFFFRTFGIREGGLAAFREQARQNMETELKQKLLGTMKKAMLDQLLEMNNVQPPKTLVDRETERMRNQSGENQTGYQKDDDLAAQARHRVACGILLTELARKLGISPTPDQVREKIEFLAQTYENPEEVVAWYYSSQEQLASAEAMVTEELLVNYVLEHGQVTEKPMSFAEMMES